MGLKDFSGTPPNDQNGNGSGWTNGSGGSGVPSSGMFIQPNPPAQGTDIEDILINYNKRFQSASPALFRDVHVYQALSILISKNKPNALLIGPAGTGKTKIVEDLARRIVNNDPMIPTSLYGYTVYELPVANILAGTKYRGEMEQKVQNIIAFAEDPKNKVILFIDEIHQLISRNESHNEIAQILKPALARGNMRVIGATTLQEARDLMDDPAFNRRFSRLIVEEFTRDQTIEILKHLKAGFFKHYSNRVMVSDDLMETVAILADEYKPAGSHRPDNAITLLDRSMGNAIMERKAMEEKAKNDPALLQAIQSVPYITLSEQQIRSTAMKLMTGNSKKEALDAASLGAKFTAIKGQDNILEKLVDTLKRNDLALFPKTRPLVMLFAGNSGVGKTEVAKIIAKELTGVKPIMLNMTEYRHSDTINRLIGAPPGYVGSDSNQELPFDILESNPYQVIVLDEFEKCCKEVQGLFMSVFEEGLLKTNRNKEIDFSRAIIIATTNAGHTDQRAPLGFTATEPTVSLKDTVDTLSKWFDVALINRFDHILTFNPLSETIYREILVDLYAKEYDRLMKEKPRAVSKVLTPIMPDEDLETIIKDTYVESLGARPAGKAIREYLENKIISP